VLKAHVGDVINVDFGLKNDDQCLSVHFDCENRRREEKFANHGLPLWCDKMNAESSSWTAETYFGVDDL